MSRGRLGAHVRRPGFPRVSGDEPKIADAASLLASFSPRERG